ATVGQTDTEDPLVTAPYAGDSDPETAVRAEEGSGGAEVVRGELRVVDEATLMGPEAADLLGWLDPETFVGQGLRRVELAHVQRWELGGKLRSLENLVWDADLSVKLGDALDLESGEIWDEHARGVVAAQPGRVGVAEVVSPVLPAELCFP